MARLTRLLIRPEVTWNSIYFHVSYPRRVPYNNLRERALICLEKGTLELRQNQSKDQQQLRNDKKWWITRSWNYQSTMSVDLRPFIQLDGFNFFYKTNGIVVMIPSDWTDDELKETVWDNMIPHTGVCPLLTYLWLNPETSHCGSICRGRYGFGPTTRHTQWTNNPHILSINVFTIVSYAQHPAIISVVLSQSFMSYTTFSTCCYGTSKRRLYMALVLLNGTIWQHGCK
jgi:hypothetical protein